MHQQKQNHKTTITSKDLNTPKLTKTGIDKIERNKSRKGRAAPRHPNATISVTTYQALNNIFFPERDHILPTVNWPVLVRVNYLKLINEVTLDEL